MSSGYSLSYLSPSGTTSYLSRGYACSYSQSLSLNSRTVMSLRQTARQVLPGRLRQNCLEVNLFQMGARMLIGFFTLSSPGWRGASWPYTLGNWKARVVWDSQAWLDTVWTAGGRAYYYDFVTVTACVVRPLAYTDLQAIATVWTDEVAWLDKYGVQRSWKSSGRALAPRYSQEYEVKQPYLENAHVDAV